MWIFIIGIIILVGLFNPSFGLFGDTYYSPKRKQEPQISKPNHHSFKLTKGD